MEGVSLHVSAGKLVEAFVRDNEPWQVSRITINVDPKDWGWEVVATVADSEGQFLADVPATIDSIEGFRLVLEGLRGDEEGER